MEEAEFPSLKQAITAMLVEVEGEHEASIP